MLTTVSCDWAISWEQKKSDDLSRFLPFVTLCNCVMFTSILAQDP